MTAQTKRALRKALRAEREALSAEARAEASQAIAQRIAASGMLCDGAVVGLFWPMRGELDPNVVLDHPCARGIVPVWPRSERATRSMAFCRAEVPGDAPAPGWPGARAAVEASLARGAYGIWEPTGASVDARALDLVIVPGLAFDRSGHRLGFGAGYYDRFLARAPQARCLGLALDAHLLDTLPHEAHDQPVDGVVTPSRLWWP